MSEIPAANAFGGMSDYQLQQAISHLSTAAAHASPAPQQANNKNYQKHLHTWASTPTSTPPPGGARNTPGPSNPTSTRPTRSRNTRPYAVAQPYTPIPAANMTGAYPPVQLAPVVPGLASNPPRPPLPTTTQALHSTYASRLRTGCTLLMQPTLVSSGGGGAASGPGASGAGGSGALGGAAGGGSIGGGGGGTRSTRRGGAVVNYADPGSGDDDFLDAGALDSDDSDFVAGGGTRTSLKQARGTPVANGRAGMNAGINVFSSTGGGQQRRHAGQPGSALQQQLSMELDQSYLGTIPPGRFIKSRMMLPTTHEYPTPEVMERQAQKRTSLVPIRVEFETDTHRVRDCFVWNYNEGIIRPELFAKTFCNDLDLPNTWIDTVANQIRAQLEEHEGVAALELGIDGALDADSGDPGDGGDEVPECRVILSIDVQIANHHLMDHIEWDLLSPLTPEAFSQKLCNELGLNGEAVPLVAHAVHEELVKHKKDAVEWGVIGADAGAAERDRERGVMKDKTGLGLGWGRAPKEGRGPKRLRSVWRDWAEAEEFRTKFEELTAEEVERREIEKERASRRLRRETSKFQYQTTTRSRRR